MKLVGSTSPKDLRQAVELRRKAARFCNEGRMKAFEAADKIATAAYVALSASDQRAFLRRVRFQSIPGIEAQDI